MSGDFKAALAAADARLPTDAQLRRMHARLDARLFRPAPPPRRGLAFAVALASVAAGFVAVRFLAPQPAPVVGGFELTREAAARVQVTREASVELPAEVTVVDRARGVRVSSLERTTLRREARGIRVLQGRAVFEVEKRPVDAGPVRVLVSGGSIEVHGTRFTVKETGLGIGSVELHEGVIDFVDEGGAPQRLRPGEVLAWPRPPAPPSDAALEEEDDELVPLGPVRPRPVRPTKKQTDIDWRPFDQRVHAQAVITELTELRQKGLWSDAVRLLERELNRGAPDTRERLSFELGLLYTWQLKDSSAACAHWKQHRREYPEGRFEVEVERALSTLGCTP